MSANLRAKFGSIVDSGATPEPRPEEAAQGHTGAHTPDVAATCRRVAGLLAELGQALEDLAQDAENQLAELARPERVSGAVETAPVAQPTARLLSAKDIADLVGVDAKTVRRWRSEATIPPAIEIGGVVRWRMTVIQEWLAAREGAQ